MEVSILETQHEFVTSEAKKALFLGGVGCVAPDTMIDVEIFGKPERVEISSDRLQVSKSVRYLSFNGIALDYRIGSRPFLKGKGEMFRVVSEEGEIDVFEHHEFLCSDGIYRYPSAFLDSDFCAPLSTKKQNEAYFLLEDIYLLFDRIFKFIKWFVVRPPMFRSVAYLFTGRFFDPTLEQLIAYLEKLIEAIQSNVEIFSVRITNYDSVSHPLNQNSLVHFYNEFAYELARLAHDQLPALMKGQKNKDQILKTVNRLTKIWEKHDFRYSPTDLSRNKILAVESLGIGEYWDLQVPDTHNYVAHGFIHHNSGKTYSGGDIALNLVSKYPRTIGLLTAGTYQQLVNSTVKALCDRWDEIGLVNGVDYKTVLSGARKRIDLLGSQIFLYSLNKDVPAKGVTVGWWLGDESSYVKKKPLIPAERE